MISTCRVNVDFGSWPICLGESTYAPVITTRYFIIKEKKKYKKNKTQVSRSCYCSRYVNSTICTNLRAVTFHMYQHIRLPTCTLKYITAEMVTKLLCYYLSVIARCCEGKIGSLHSSFLSRSVLMRLSIESNCCGIIL